ncbi:BlaI/MecI/CopY family transcriptional regulator [Paucibacter sp. R3-3]|uniref:BlaI/MecI/CopY family transcriptional regulator n=1 Tax=Roseateles agri TaxID=3098619 RepID=A0ABU5DCQ3_9BURK|nr:BlaI/MecI/CopY family transcriptional regulator [Paucibacter sp. R3-3]MDY0744053.1 BlaI/MecI/CopY family transcriptional regulator [Paucibacter sp. R3-3]
MSDEEDGNVSLSELQLALMRQLWMRGDGGEASTAEVAEGLRNERGLAHTTVATLLTRLEKRGLVASRREGRGLVYRALVSEAQVQRSMVSGLLSNLFEGKASALLTHLLAQNEIGDSDLAQMRALLSKRKGGGGHAD